MCRNNDCQVQVFKYNGNHWKYNGNYRINFFVLNDSKLNGKCPVVSEKVKRPILSFSYGLPFFQFMKMDQVLQRRLYSICFPVQKKRLWNCSKSSANLGKKPTTLLLSAITDCTQEYFFMSPRKLIDNFKIDGPSLGPSVWLPKNAIVCAKTNRVVMENIVLNLVGNFDGRGFVQDILEHEITEMNKFVEFNHSKVEFGYDIPLRFLQMFTPNVRKVVFVNEEEEDSVDDYDHFNFDIVFNHLPNVEEIEFCDFDLTKLFVEINRDFGPKLTKMDFSLGFNAETYDLLAEVMRKQSSNCCFHVRYRHKQSDDQSAASRLELHMKNILLYFEPVANPASNRVGLIFSYRGDYHYFVLRDLPDVSDPALNANHFVPIIQPGIQSGEFQQLRFSQPIEQYQPFNPILFPPYYQQQIQQRFYQPQLLPPFLNQQQIQQFPGIWQQVNHYEPVPQQSVHYQQFRQPFLVRPQEYQQFPNQHQIFPQNVSYVGNIDHQQHIPQQMRPFNPPQQ